MADGYMGKILRIDLTDKSVAEEALKAEVLRQFIGGSGLGAKILFDETDGSTDPLSPQNVLIYLTGPFVNTPVPTSGRHSIVARSPLTGIWGESDIGGKWGVWLKSLGYDGLVVKGVSEYPVYVYIGIGKIEIREARHLWGKDTYEIEGLLQEELGHEIAISCIGIAGENLVKFASIMHEGKHARAAGRCGLGAVMGSKKLKAIVLKRGKLKPSLHNREELLKDIKRIVPLLKEIKKDSTLYGTSRSITPAEALGDLPIKNWQLGNWSEGAEKINGRKMAETILVGRYSCHGCPVACGRVVKVSNGSFSPVDGGGYEYETGAMLGSNCLVDDMEAISKANELCNRYGMDTITAGSVIAFAMEAFERGILTEANTEGLRINWGEPEILLKLIGLIAKREGVGDILAEGSKRASDILGHNASDFAIHVKHLELPGHDPRCFNGLGLGYATSNRGACHTNSFAYIYMGRTTDASLNILESFDRLGIEGTGKLVAVLQNFMTLCDSLNICKFTASGLQAGDFHRWLNWITGWDIDLEEFLKIGERIYNLKRLYNVKCGIARKDDTLPERILNLKREGLHAPERLPNLNKMLDEYYEVRGWGENGIPRRETLSHLGLENIS
jgi:aldehyde:ferredoxin oxidoreductase